ncbi:hypothetical protein M8845_01855 [Gelidibacter japonicus]|jgi:hypothetical protein|uniref:hypothetical protein n=1 Tax=Gelidibacter japonicus TaxID=1962232 RepID=UPI0020226C0C|nr:hypothetical protein [Gelidibacter japonicus]MCL8006162.1 hypothetical protein [Gelidibacter japonicus]
MMEKNKNNIKNSSNVSDQEKDLLGERPKNLRTDGGDDIQLNKNHRSHPVDFEGKDLDIPGRSLPEDRSKKELKDEENQLYSQGGPDNDKLEENGNDQ